MSMTSNQSLSYSAHKSLKINHNISMAQLCKITHISTKSQLLCITVKIFVKMFLNIKFTLEYFILYKTYQSLSGSQKFSLDSHCGTKISPQNISF